jgi:Protein of unknown function (DUF3237)
MNDRLPEPRPTEIYRLEATLGVPLHLGEISSGHRRIVPLSGGTFNGSELRGRLLPGASADWQIILPDGTALGDEVDASEYTSRTSIKIETAAADLDWPNKGVFISVAGRQPGGVIYEVYLVR